MGLTTLFLDMNAYFASVEQQLRPELRGHPVAVAAVETDSTCCIAVSYEAKQWGIKTGTLVGEARRQCPSLQVIEARPPVYLQTHHAIVAAVESCLPVQAVHSIDEMSCRLTGPQRRPEVALELARQVKQAIAGRVGQFLRCSVGLAPNRFLAKVATDLQKPDGLVMLTEADLPGRLLGLQLRDLPGIGPRMLERLQRCDIWTMEQLYQASERRLQRAWRGVVGRQMWHWLRGYDLPERPTRRSTVGHSHVLPPVLRTDEGARAVLVRLIHRAAARLRSLEYWARHLEIYVSFTFREEGWRTTVPLGVCQDTLTMLQALSAVWNDPRRPRGRPTQVAATLFDLIPDRGVALSLFPAERDRVRLSRTIDDLNAQFGTNAIYFGGMHEVLDSAPLRIAFTQIAELEPEVS